MSVLIVKNVANEGPGTIAHYLDSASLPYSTVEPDNIAATSLPDHCSHLVILGGPMGVYELDQYPHVRASLALIEAALKRNLPTLGVCLGAQLLAHALGARVYKGNAQEIGWMPITLTPEGASHPLMQTLMQGDSAVTTVFQWHGDTFDIPAGARTMASSDLFPNQAFVYNESVWALQFHIEVTNHITRQWLGNRNDVTVELPEPGYQEYLNRANRYYRKFFDVSEHQST